MVFWVSNNARHTLGPAERLHVTDECRILKLPNNHAHEATPDEILKLERLCGACAPALTGPER